MGYVSDLMVAEEMATERILEVPEPVTRPEPIPFHELTGYIAGPPDEASARIDSRGARLWKCEHCGHRGLSYRPYTRFYRWAPALIFSYRAFFECPSCRHAMEV